MEKELLAISDGTFTLAETENENQFYFYRNDGEVLTDICEEPMDLFGAYMAHKMAEGGIPSMIIHNICLEMSDDEKCIRLTLCDVEKASSESTSSTANQKQPNFLKRLLHKVFG